MLDLICHAGTGVALLVLFTGLILVVGWTVQRARGPAGTLAYAGGQPTATESWQAQYAQGKITREQYERKKQNTGQSNVSETHKGESK